MRKWLLLFFLFAGTTVIGQPFRYVELSHGIGRVNDSLNWPHITRMLGAPDSLTDYSQPYAKNTAYYELHYPVLGMNIRFSGRKPEETDFWFIELFSNSTIRVNGFLPAALDTQQVRQLFGKPHSVSVYAKEIIFDYTLREDEKAGTLLMIHFSREGRFTKLTVHFVRYLNQ